MYGNGARSPLRISKLLKTCITTWLSDRIGSHSSSKSPSLLSCFERLAVGSPITISNFHLKTTPGTGATADNASKPIQAVLMHNITISTDYRNFSCGNIVVANPCVILFVTNLARADECQFRDPRFGAVCTKCVKRSGEVSKLMNGCKFYILEVAEGTVAPI